MKTEKSEQAVSRRAFLRSAGLGAGAAGAAAIALASGAPVKQAAAAERVKTSGYRETEHVRQVYRLARF